MMKRLHEKASITVFLSLLLVLFIGFIMMTDDFVPLPAFFIPPHPAEGHRGQAQLHRGAGEYRLKGGRRGAAGPTVGRRAARRAEPS